MSRGVSMSRGRDVWCTVYGVWVLNEGQEGRKGGGSLLFCALMSGIAKLSDSGRAQNYVGGETRILIPKVQ